ncbi:malonic semialdehyde reductase [Acidomonas methanolica]|uniref:malonic semialdehyde reductase n=1 Tax=Acidomonas methanolica TaxID=437 RepID=UPI00211A7E12|nr:malonic semialdehyde reductase [Acidomonas methanolica]MCQ9155691.1 malonic semialdehyde reductase [Acidomonas methanolica]
MSGVVAPEGGVLSDEGLDRLFRQARTPRRFGPRPVPPEILTSVYDLAKLGPTSGNCCPGRVVFLTSEGAKARLVPALSPANVALCASAPVVAVVCHDPLFFEMLPRLNDEAGLRDWFAADVGLSDETALRNGTLQGAYLILAARALGLDAAPMSGFDSFLVEDGLLASTGWRANFLIALGYAEDAPAAPRAPRPDFAEACRVL